MGRCYEFGPQIVEGCRHAMVVAEDGSACACPKCGAHCTGRFNACGTILAQPGHIPPGAPVWVGDVDPATTEIAVSIGAADNGRRARSTLTRTGPGAILAAAGIAPAPQPDHPARFGHGQPERLTRDAETELELRSAVEAGIATATAPLLDELASVRHDLAVVRRQLDDQHAASLDLGVRLGALRASIERAATVTPTLHAMREEQAAVAGAMRVLPEIIRRLLIDHEVRLAAEGVTPTERAALVPELVASMPLSPATSDDRTRRGVSGPADRAADRAAQSAAAAVRAVSSLAGEASRIVKKRRRV